MTEHEAEINDLQNHIASLSEENSSLKDQLIEVGDRVAEYRSVVGDVVQTLGHVGNDPTDLLDAVGQVAALLEGKESIDRNDLVGLAEQIRHALREQRRCSANYHGLRQGLELGEFKTRDGSTFMDMPLRACDHGVHFDEAAAIGLEAYVIRQRWPRLNGKCPLGCGYEGIAYASTLHFVAGDW